MRNFYFYKKRIIYCSFIVMIVLQLLFSCVSEWYFYPSWSMMILIYWVIMTPKQVSIGIGFILGLITDCIFNTILGIHALSFSIISYCLIRKIYFFQNASVLQQSFFIIFFSLIDNILKLFITFLITKVLSYSDFFWNCILNGILWPFLLFLMHKIHSNK